jgi:hypothetical protein
MKIPKCQPWDAIFSSVFYASTMMPTRLTIGFIVALSVKTIFRWVQIRVADALPFSKASRMGKRRGLKRAPHIYDGNAFNLQWALV